MRILLPLVCAAALVASDSDYQQFDSRAMLGVNMTPPSSSTQTANGTEPDVGVETQAVYPGTAAERMGIQTGDLITAVNGGTIGSMNDLRNEIALTGVGGQATVEVLRGGQKLVLTDTLNEWPKNIPYEPIDDAAERRFRDWQARRLDRTQQAVTNLRKQVEDYERRSNGSGGNDDSAGKGPMSPTQAMKLPASKALALLPAYHLTLRLAHDSPDASLALADSTIAWDARVLIGTHQTAIY
jgi:membrane-associated protease RseP (regulator of RpoE activity)